MSYLFSFLYAPAEICAMPKQNNFYSDGSTPKGAIRFLSAMFGMLPAFKDISLVVK